MHSSTQRAPRARPNVRGLLTAAVAVSLVGLIAHPAYADNDRGDHGGDRHGDRDRDRGNDRHRVEHRRYPVYAPAPVYYPREESPGINLFIPLWNR